MYSRILIAVDSSETSRHALEHAVELARGTSAALRVIHVVDMSWLPLGPEVAVDTQADAASRRAGGEATLASARDAVVRLGFDAEAVLAETETPREDVAEVIVKEAARWSADIVVMGSHGRQGFQRLLLGSTAEQTSRIAPVPVLLVPSLTVAPAD